MPAYDRLEVDQLTAAGSAWLKKLLETIESLDIDAYVALMSPDVELMLDNGASNLTGRDAVRAALSEQWAPLAKILHHEINAYGTDIRFVHESIVDFTMRDGSSSTGRSTGWINRDSDGRLAVARIYGGAS